MLIALVISACLGIFLWSTSRQVLAQSQKAVEAGEQVVTRGREVVAESQKVSAVVQMNIVKDPVYGDNPALLDAFKSDAAKQDDRLKQQQQALEAQAANLKQQSADIASQQRVMFVAPVHRAHGPRSGDRVRRHRGHASRGGPHPQDEAPAQRRGGRPLGESRRRSARAMSSSSSSRRSAGW